MAMWRNQHASLGFYQHKLQQPQQTACIDACDVFALVTLRLRQLQSALCFFSTTIIIKELAQGAGKIRALELNSLATFHSCFPKHLTTCEKISRFFRNKLFIKSH